MPAFHRHPLPVIIGHALANLTWGLSLLLALCVAAITVLAAWQYGQSIGSTPDEAFGTAAALSVADIFKAVLPILVLTAWARGHRVVPAVCALGFVGLALLSVWGVVSVTVLQRASIAAVHDTEARRVADLRSRLTEITSRLDQLGNPPPVAAVQASLRALQADRRWSTTVECSTSSITASSSRSFCAEYARGLAEAERAGEAAALRVEAERLRSQLAVTPPPRPANAELALIARLTGLDADGVGLARATGLALVLELVGSLGLSLAWLARPGPLPAPVGVPVTAPSAPVAVGDHRPSQVALPQPVQVEDQQPLAVPVQVEDQPAIAVPSARPVAVDDQQRASPAISASVAAAASSTRRTSSKRTRGSTRSATRGPSLSVVGSHIPAYATQRLKRRKGASVSAADLYTDYHAWCAASGVEPVSQKSFGAELRALGFRSSRAKGRVVYRDVHMLPATIAA